jgi:hypothetical protein
VPQLTASMGRDMTIEDAMRMAALVNNANELLREAFPCRECDGSGEGGWDRHAERLPCQQCWGRGWTVDATQLSASTDREGDQ